MMQRLELIYKVNSLTNLEGALLTQVLRGVGRSFIRTGVSARMGTRSIAIA